MTPDSGPLRITLVEPNPAGGLFQFAFQLGSALGELGHQVVLLTGPRPELRSTTDRFRVVPVLPTWHGGEGRSNIVRKLRRVVRGARYLAAWATVYWHVARTRPDVLQLAEWRFFIDGPLAAILAERRWSAVTVDLAHSPIPLEEQRNTGSSYRQGPLLRWGLSRGYRSMDSVLVLGRASRDDQHAHWPSTRRVDVVPHGDETALVQASPPPPSANEPTVTFFGSLTRYKGIDVLLAAHERILQTTPGARLVIAGAPMPDLDVGELRRAVSALPGAELHEGYVPIEEVGTLVGEARVVVAPYRRSNASGVVRLAQTLGRPVVVTDVGDLAETVSDGETGFVVPPEDPEALATAVGRVLADPELADRLGAEGERRLRATASWPVVATQVVNVYRSLLSDRKPDRAR
jgi:glycosyltransferase involved in cell wall biosynthesis